jgi:hypothetical protein
LFVEIGGLISSDFDPVLVCAWPFPKQSTRGPGAAAVQQHRRSNRQASA